MQLVSERVIDLGVSHAAARARMLAELRDAHGRWVTGPGHNDALDKAATGRHAGAVRLHDHVLYGKTEMADNGFGFQSRVVPMEVTGLHHHWEGTGKKRKRFTDMDLLDPITGETHSESLKDGSSVKLFPREDMRAVRRGAPAATPRPAAPRPKPVAPPPPPPRPVPQRAPAPAPVAAAPPTAPAAHVSGKTLAGMDLWKSGEGTVPDVTPAEANAAKTVWFRDTFSYTNDYLRHGTMPSASAKAALYDNKHSFLGGYGANRLQLPTKDDAEYIRDIGTLKAMMERAPAFTRPATMYRDVTGPDQVFGPVGSMKGKVFSDKGFMSATTDAATSEMYGGEDKGLPTDKIIIKVPVGGRASRAQPAFFSKGTRDYGKEKEYTFPPGTRFRVDDDRMVGGKRQTTVTQVVPAGAKPGPRPTPAPPAFYTRETDPFASWGYSDVMNADTGQWAGRVSRSGKQLDATLPNGKSIGKFPSWDAAELALKGRFAW
jgi:hypothetical protein